MKWSAYWGGEYMQSKKKKAMGTSERISRAAYVLFAFVSRIHTNILFFQFGMWTLFWILSPLLF